MLIGLAVLAVIAASLATYFAVRGGGGSAQVRGDTLVRIDPATNKVVDSVRVGPRASSVTFAQGYLWVTSPSD